MKKRKRKKIKFIKEINKIITGGFNKKHQFNSIIKFKTSIKIIYKIENKLVKTK